MSLDQLHVLADDFANSDFLTDRDRESFKSRTNETLQHELQTIQSKRELKMTMIHMRRIEPFLQGMIQLEKVLSAIGFPHVAEIMRYIWGPAQFLLEITNIVERAFDDVLDAYEVLGSQIPPLYDYVRFFTELPEATECLVRIYEDILTFHRLAYKLFSLRLKVWQKLHRPTWKGLSPTIEHLKKSLQKHGKLIQDHGSSLRNPTINLDQNSELLREDFGPEISDTWEIAKFGLHQYRHDVMKCRSCFQEDERARKQKEKRRVLSWISGSEKIHSLHKSFQDCRVCPSTGRWLFRSRRYSEVMDWMKEDFPPESAIFVHGSRGFGKTVLASLIIDELKDLSSGSRSNTIPRESKTYYFYCREEDPDLCTYLDVLKGILHQVVDDNEDLLPFCAERMSSSGSLTLENPEIIKTLFETFFEYNSRQYIIIDGLDECKLSDRISTANFFMDQTRNCDRNIKNGCLRVLFMGHPMPELTKDGLLPQGDACVELKPTDNAEDIRAYVRKRMPEFSQKGATNGGFNLSEADEAQIENFVCSRSKEMFLYAHLVIDFLLHQPNKDKLLGNIRGGEIVPGKLSQIYKKLLEAVKLRLKELEDGDAHWELARLLLGWLIFAKRPLKWHEMQAILSYDHKRQMVDFDNKMLRQDAQKYLGSLVHVANGDHIRMIHSTARGYIVENERINAQAVQCDLAIMCLKYLCLLALSNQHNQYERQEKVKLGWASFQDYACSHWHGHIATVLSDCRDLFDDIEIGPQYKEEFGSALQHFIDMNREALTEDLHQDLQQPNPQQPSPEGFRGFLFYENLRTVWNHIYTHQKGTYDVRNTVGIAEVEKALEENRRVLEENFKPNSYACMNDTIRDYYGPNLFKCKRLLCKFFFLGYDNERDRKDHDSRHDRPYQCPKNCNYAPIGFCSEKDQLRHIRIYHPDLTEGPTVFETFRPRVSVSRFVCEICHKDFTRKITLQGHQRSHFGERPYSCSHCNRAFARLNDCRRHERIHTRDRR